MDKLYKLNNSELRFLDNKLKFIYRWNVLDPVYGIKRSLAKDYFDEHLPRIFKENVGAIINYFRSSLSEISTPRISNIKEYLE